MSTMIADAKNPGNIPKRRLSFTLNGKREAVELSEAKTVLEMLRDDFDVTSVKRGCETGECGACTILLDGEPVNACMVLADECEGRAVVTVEGLIKPGKPNPLQDAFIRLGAIQCGFCTPGMLISAKALLDKNPKPSEDEVRHAIAGNLCRCTGYKSIVEAILEAARSNGRPTPPRGFRGAGPPFGPPGLDGHRASGTVQYRRGRKR